MLQDAPGISGLHPLNLILGLGEMMNSYLTVPNISLLMGRAQEKPTDRREDFFETIYGETTQAARYRSKIYAAA